jgi:imidazolonepropionase-like amidohydrolase
LTGATVIDGAGGTALADHTILVRNGEIEAVGPRASTPVPAGYEVRDATGLYVVPGLIDAHVHLSQTGWADGRPDILDVRDAFPYETVMAEQRAHPEVMFDAYLASGVTAVFDVGGYPWTVDLARETDGIDRAPHVVAAGPMLTTVDHWLNLPGERQFLAMDSDSATRDAVQYLHSLGAAAVNVWFLPVPDTEFVTMERRVQVAAREAEALGMPLLVHATTLREARVAVEAGAHLLVHSVTDAEVDSAFVADMAARGTLYCPTLTVTAGYLELLAAAQDGREPVLDDPRGCVNDALAERIARTADVGRRGGRDLEDLRERLAGELFRARYNLLRLLEGGVPVVLGTDAGNPLTLHGLSVFAELEALQAAGLSPRQVLEAATSHAARALGRDDLGGLEPGMAADLLVLEADPLEDAAHFRRIRALVRGGEYRPADEACP